MSPAEWIQQLSNWYLNACLKKSFMEVEKDPWSYIWLPTTWWCKDPEHLWWYLATSRPQYSCFSSTRVNDLALIQAPWIHDALKWAAGDAILSPKLNFDFFFWKLRNQHFISLCKILKQEASWPYKLRCKTLYMYQYRPHSTIPICGCRLVIALVERLWNSLNTTIGACHGLLHSLKKYIQHRPHSTIQIVQGRSVCETVYTEPLQMTSDCLTV